MDLEGTDGRERGEDDTTFEKQSALFALAVSDIVLINMWCHDIGREQAANKSLLRTVFQVMIHLFCPKKTTLLFVIRDKTKVELLRYQFMHSIAPGGLLGDRKGVLPASGFSFSVQQMWKVIKENKDLDLPAHKVMVATVRCEEIANEKLSFLASDEEWLELSEAVQSGFVPGFGKKLTSLLDAHLFGYDKETVYFDEGVRTAKRQQLESRLLQEAYRRSNASLPSPWAVVAIALLGFNELMMLVRHPLYLLAIFVTFLVSRALWIRLDITGEFQHGTLSGILSISYKLLRRLAKALKQQPHNQASVRSTAMDSSS